MRFHLLHPREQIVTIMNRIYQSGMTTLSGGNLSIREDNGDIWITPAGVDKGKLTAKDIMRVHADGTVEGAHRPSSEFPFHRAIYAKRPDLRAIVHAHPSALVSFSIIRRVPTTNIIPQAQYVCGAVGYAPYALPGSEQLGENIAATFAQGYDAVLLENHGAATAGSDLLTAFQRLETLDFCARTLLRAEKLGSVTTLGDEQLAPFRAEHEPLPEFTPAAHSSRERDLRQQLVDIVQRACDRQLMISTEGTASARVGHNCFVITPTAIDRRGFQIEDLVLIEDGKREAGKTPSRSVHLHAAIYQQHPGIHAILTAQSPAATAYAVTASHFDTRSIPESYILLRDIPLLPYGVHYTQPERIAELVSLRTPVLLIQNDCVVTVGRTVLEAFDRLEVAEFSAQALIDAASIGVFSPIDAEGIRALEVAFALE